MFLGIILAEGGPIYPPSLRATEDGLEKLKLFLASIGE